MTLLTAALAACVTTVIWYKTSPNSKMMPGVLCLMYWGATLMWLVDAVFEFAKSGAEYFNPAPADMLNDLFLGLSVVVLGMVIWLVIVLVRDPKGVIRAALFKKDKT